MAKLIIKLKKSQATRMKKHLAKEHPITKGKMKITKKKAKSILKKAFTGAKKGVKETSKFVGEYGPKVHKYAGGVAEGIHGAFATPRHQQIPRQRRRRLIADVISARTPKMSPIVKAPKNKKVNFNNLSIEM